MYTSQSQLTFLFSFELATDALHHVVECAEVICKCVVIFLVQPRDTAECVPAELARLKVTLHAKGRHDTIEVGLLPSRPPAVVEGTTQCHQAEQIEGLSQRGSSGSSIDE